MKHKFLKATLGLFSVLALAGCSKPIPEGPVKDFVMEFDLNNAFDSVEYATSTITSIKVVDGVEEGRAKTITQIHKKNNSYYQYLYNEVHGSYHSEVDQNVNFDKQETLTYGDKTVGASLSIELTDGVLKDLNYTKEQLDAAITSFFYQDNKDNFHQGGMYYADYILLKASKMHEFFTLNEDKTILTFELNSLSEYNGQKVINRQKFQVNKYGMLLNSTARTELYDNLSTYTETKVVCNYEAFDLKENLV